MADGVDVSNGAIGFHNSKLDVAVHSLAKRLITCHLEFDNILWMYPLHPLVPQGQSLCWIEGEESEHLVRPVEDLTAGAINGTTACMSHALCFRQIGLAASKA